MMEPISAAILGGSQLTGGLFNLGFQWWAMRKQVEENRRAEALGLQIREEDLKLAQLWKNKDFQLQLKNFGLKEDEMAMMQDKFEWNKELAELSRGDAQERQNYNRIQNFAGNMVNQINKNRDFKTNLINTMGARRAA